MQDRVLADATHKDMANAIRALAMDAVQKANSGHPGMPMGMADVATVLFTRFLNFDASHPDWPDRDRFVLSAGHGSMLIYALLYLTGYPDMDLSEIERFRQLGSRTAGHPEYGHAPGIETTTGPLGQGIGNAVGMALAERLLNQRYGDDIVSHFTYCLASDGCLMEGISQEAISLAGHLKLGRLIVLFDDNQISIDGPTDLAVTDDQLARFGASGWHTAAVDGHDPEAIALAIENARNVTGQPSMIACRTLIGYGAPNKEGTSSTHGAPLARKRLQEPVRNSAGIIHRSWCRKRFFPSGAKRVRGTEPPSISGPMLQAGWMHQRGHILSIRLTRRLLRRFPRLSQASRLTLLRRRQSSPRANPRRKYWSGWSPSCLA